MEHKHIAIMILPVFVGTLILGILAATGNAQVSNNTAMTEVGSSEPACINEHGQEQLCLSPQTGTAAPGASNTPSSQVSGTAATCTAASAPCEQTITASPDEQTAILAIHNRERTAVGTPNLVWSASLAADAATYLDKMVAQNGGMIFSSDPPGAPDGSMLRHDPNIPSGQGENLAFKADAASRVNNVNTPSVESLLQGWVKEKPYLGGHYTQMVWKTTKEVGCATATVRGMTQGMHGVAVYLNCRYSPPGNFVGQKPF